MTKFTGTRHVLAVQDLKKSVAYYIDQLNFKCAWTDDNWAFLQRNEFFLMLGECREDVSAYETNNHSYFAYVETTSIDSFFNECKINGIEITSTLANQPWGQREFGIRTIDGHRIMFGEPLNDN